MPAQAPPPPEGTGAAPGASGGLLGIKHTCCPSTRRPRAACSRVRAAGPRPGQLTPPVGGLCGRHTVGTGLRPVYPVHAPATRPSLPLEPVPVRKTVAVTTQLGGGAIHVQNASRDAQKRPRGQIWVPGEAGPCLTRARAQGQTPAAPRVHPNPRLSTENSAQTCISGGGFSPPTPTHRSSVLKPLTQKLQD